MIIMVMYSAITGSSNAQDFIRRTRRGILTSIWTVPSFREFILNGLLKDTSEMPSYQEMRHTCRAVARSVPIVSPNAMVSRGGGGGW